MSNIFNLLGGIAETNRGQVMKPITQFKSSHEINLKSSHKMEDVKPKGLSMRSRSAMNISHTKSLILTKKKTYDDKEKKFLKPVITQIDEHGRPISPGKKIATKTLIPQPIKGLSINKDVAIDKSMKTEKVLKNNIFKKPLSLKKGFKKFVEPENLTHYYEDQHEFDYGYIEAIEKDLKNSFLKEKKNIVPYEEKEFISNLDMVISTEIPKLIFPEFDEEYAQLSSPKLPEIFED